MPKFMITTVSTFTHKYVIEADSAELANEEWRKLDENVYEDTYADCCEISQIFEGEHLVKTTEVNDDEIIIEADEYLKDFVLNRVRKVPH